MYCFIVTSGNQKVNDGSLGRVGMSGALAINFTATAITSMQHLEPAEENLFFPSNQCLPGSCQPVLRTV